MAEAEAATQQDQPETDAAPVRDPRAGRAPALLPGSGEGAGLEFVLDVPLRVSVEIGTARMLVREVVQLARGSVVELDRAATDPADVRVNGRLVARGEVTVVDDRLAVRLVEVVGRETSGEDASG